VGARLRPLSGPNWSGENMAGMQRGRQLPEGVGALAIADCPIARLPVVPLLGLHRNRDLPLIVRLVGLGYLGGRIGNGAYRIGV
jgi:hypothetical protein